MIAGMFAYSVDWRAFYSFTLPIMLPALSTLLWPENIFPWPFVVGLTAFYFVVLSIARNFSKLFSESVKLKFGNQQLYQELAAERDESIAANISKSKFIAVASHDLRQPLHAVNINIELFDLSDLSRKNFNIVRKIKNSMMGLNNMFEALLNMSKLDSFASNVSKDYFEVHELTDAIRDVVESRAVAKGLMFSINRPSFVVHGDKLLLQQLLVNLVMNAIQYTNRGQVEVVFANQMGHLVVDVIDTGVGISAEDQINIFNEFFRAKNTRDSHEGLGLGLSIVRRLCRLMDMSISLDSKTGEGSKFTLTTHHQVIHENQPIKPVSMVSSDQGHKDRTLAGKVIAIIEDDEVIVDAYRQTLLAKGATIVVLSEQDEELQLQLEAIDQIDCILSDYRLKNTNGIALIEKIRENFNSDIPAVIVTGDVSPENIKAFKGFNAIVLHKPLTLAKISESMIAVIHGD